MNREALGKWCRRRSYGERMDVSAKSQSRIGTDRLVCHRERVVTELRQLMPNRKVVQITADVSK